MNDLTKRQEEVLTVIKKYIAQNNYSPTIREIGKMLNLSSPATIQYYIELLERKGYLKKENSKTRTIELLVDNEFIKSDVSNIPLISTKNINQYKKNEKISISSSIISKKGFALVYKDNSMIKNINKNDIVLVDIVPFKESDIVAVSENNKITLKEYKNNINKEEVLGKAIGIYKKL